MKFAGIIAEYDPFHNGHAWQLAQAKALGAQHVAVAMSCGLTQRGALPLLPEAVRVQAALQCGADLIFALPAPCACAGAEAFARAGVRILAAAGCDALVFGAETPDAALLMEAARVLNSEAYRTELKRQLAAGARSFAAARQAAVEALCPGTALAALLDKPNNNLAVEYCKAILEQEAPMTPVPLPRVGAGHGQALAESGHAQFASASALRALWAEQGADALTPYVPEKALELYKKAEIDGMYTDYAAAGRCELALLRAACARPEPFAAVRGVSEGLDHRLENAVRSCTGLPQLLDALTTVRYPRARMRRLAMDAALGYAAETEPQTHPQAASAAPCQPPRPAQLPVPVHPASGGMHAACRWKTADARCWPHRCTGWKAGSLPKSPSCQSAAAAPPPRQCAGWNPTRCSGRPPSALLPLSWHRPPCFPDTSAAWQEPAFPDKTRHPHFGTKAVPAAVPTPRTAPLPARKNSR